MKKPEEEARVTCEVCGDRVPVCESWCCAACGITVCSEHNEFRDCKDLCPGCAEDWDDQHQDNGVEW